MAMKDQRKYVRREASSPKAWYRTLLRSYLYRPPVWVYLIELLVFVLMVYIIIQGDSEHVIRLFAQYFWGADE
jgi:hypothetical protein